MNIRDALKKFQKLKKVPEWRECVIDLYRAERDYEAVKDMRRYLRGHVSDSPEEYVRYLRESYILTARDVFDDYMIAMEWDREKRFYLPRRASLHNLVGMLQKLEDDEADIACCSMPPGAGKSGVGLFFITHLAGKHPELGILTSSHNRDFLQGAYEECLREINTPEYLWHDIYPERKLVYTNAKDMQIGIDKAQRFNSLQFGSIGAGLAGKARAKQLLYCDDLIASSEEAFSKERLDSKWRDYTVDLVQRKEGVCKELHIATRWSVHDIIGRLSRLHEGDPRFLVLNIPALDENDRSNFDYGNGMGFTTEKYHEIRSTMDSLSWGALYMGQPVEREGLLYRKEELRRYINLPEGDPDAVLGVCDTAEGGGDDTVLPVFAVYGSDHYLIDAVVTPALPEIADNLCAQVLVRQKVNKCQFESNSAGGRTADKVAEKISELGGYCNITKKRTTQNKETKIIVESDWVKEHVLFPDERLIDKSGPVNKLINKLCEYTHMGKNKHDDVPDAMAQYAQFYRGLTGSRIEILDRRYYGI